MHSRAHKEGLSLFGVLDTTLTPLGRRLLRTWLLRPSADPKILQTRHEAVALFVRPENEGVISQVRNCLKNVTNIHVSSAVKFGIRGEKSFFVARLTESGSEPSGPADDRRLSKPLEVGFGDSLFPPSEFDVRFFSSSRRFSYFSIKIRSYLRELPRAAGVEIIFKVRFISLLASSL